MKRKGKVIVIGGNEDKGIPESERESVEKEESSRESILHRFVDETAKGVKSRIEIVPTASSEPEDTAADYLRAFELLKVGSVGVLDIWSREEACSEESLRRLEAADGIFFTGGDQMRLTSIFGGTAFYQLLMEKLDKEPFVYAGTSAGAAAASDSMIYQGRPENALRKGEVRTSTGFGLVRDVIFDTHFVNRGRIGRLFQLIVSNPNILGIGLEENTGLLFSGDKMEAIGPGMTIVVDGRNIRNSNLLQIQDGAPISIDNLTLHVMSKTDVFDLTNRTLTIKTAEEFVK